MYVCVCVCVQCFILDYDLMSWYKIILDAVKVNLIDEGTIFSETSFKSFKIFKS